MEWGYQGIRSFAAPLSGVLADSDTRSVQVASWALAHKSDQDGFQLGEKTPRQGFETEIALQNITGTSLVAVAAFDENGTCLAVSAAHNATSGDRSSFNITCKVCVRSAVPVLTNFAGEAMS